MTVILHLGDIPALPNPDAPARWLTARHFLSSRAALARHKKRTRAAFEDPVGDAGACTSGAGVQEQAEREQAAAAADAVRQALPCEDCGRPQAAGLREACGYRRRTEDLIVEAGLVATTWSADLTDPGDFAVVTADVGATMEREIATARAEYLQAMDTAEQDGDPIGTAGVHDRTRTPLVQHNPNDAEAFATATKAADAIVAPAASGSVPAQFDIILAAAAATPERPGQPVAGLGEVPRLPVRRGPRLGTQHPLRG
ncbi:hypothetical protein [Streptomyces sp. NPDC018031]|uniref:hypothetical protein n=1 Tax=Streptomyces sp. NPDC018031 TaxID=3365033 RepID=UPI0037B57FF8